MLYKTPLHEGFDPCDTEWWWCVLDGLQKALFPCGVVFTTTPSAKRLTNSTPRLDGKWLRP